MGSTSSSTRDRTPIEVRSPDTPVQNEEVDHQLQDTSASYSLETRDQGNTQPTDETNGLSPSCRSDSCRLDRHQTEVSDTSARVTLHLPPDPSIEPVNGGHGPPPSYPPPPPPLQYRHMGAAYSHSGHCTGVDCERCYKYSCHACGARSNRMMGDCWKCGRTTKGGDDSPSSPE